MKPAIVCVDDDATVLASLGEQLSRGLGEDYEIELVTNATETIDPHWCRKVMKGL